MKTSTTTLIAAMYELARTIQSDDGVANAAIFEAAERIGLQAEEIDRMKQDKTRLHLLELLATIHRDGGQYAQKVGIKQACIDADAIVSGMSAQIDAVDNLIKQAALAEREACAQVCENGHFLHDQAPTAIFGKECARAIRFRGASLDPAKPRPADRPPAAHRQ